MGGLAAYQRMSTIGQGKDRGGGSEKVLIDWLRTLDEHRRSGKVVAKLRYVRLRLDLLPLFMQGSSC